MYIPRTYFSDLSGVYMNMNKIIYPQIGNAAQRGIFLALAKEKNLKDSITEAQLMFKYSTKKIRSKELINCSKQLESIIKRGYFEFSKLGQIVNYQKTKKINNFKLNFINNNKWSVINKKDKRHIRFDFEFVPYSKKLKNIILELKVVWKIPKKVPNRVQKQLITYSKNSRKRCIVCFLVVKKFGKKTNFINTHPYWFEVNTRKAS